MAELTLTVQPGYGMFRHQNLNTATDQSTHPITGAHVVHRRA